MKKLKEAVNEIKYGSILTINKEDCPKTETQYASCLMVYDGTIFRDVKEVELGDFIKEVPNIQKKFKKGMPHKRRINPFRLLQHPLLKDHCPITAFRRK